MKLAIEEGKRGAGFVSPNPLVGCVILGREGNIIGKGHHARIGEAHAEVNALESIQDKTQIEGAQVFVTLEPCAHEGRTPSCAKTLAKLPIASVSYGLKDPNPLVSGRGAEILRAAGKNVIAYSGLQNELEELCEIFLMNMREKRPFVALKAAASLDGKIALSDGTSQWITGEPARAHTQYLRGCYDAVLAGAGTFIKDNPRLNSRDLHFATKRSKVILLDPEGITLPLLQGSALLEVRVPEDVYIVTASKRKTDLPIRQLVSPLVNGEFDLSVVLQQLYSEKINSIFIEGGAYTYSSFLRQKQADRVCLYVAPKILGDGITWSAGLTTSSLSDAISLRDMRSEKIGEDFLFSGKLVR
ncbi:MAG: bifunctional diaminohydroxyphosphoribosylaminopyrimidine deaminase/5-amino-6-(5-phosphoribosylamino)uracil reductase RibD [Bdellovibrionales bacterium]